MITIVPNDFLYLGPLAVLTLVGLLLILAEAFAIARSRRFLMQLTVAGCVMAVIASIYTWRSLEPGGHVTAFSGMLLVDRMSMFLCTLFAGITGLIAMLGAAHQHEYNWQVGEFYGLMLLAAAGMCMIAMAGDLITIFIGIETMSLAVYVMTAARRRSRAGSEGAIKYFLVGAFASGFLVYGMALLYGATGTTNLQGISRALAVTHSSSLTVAAIFMLIIAFGFKIAAIPFHMWAPDAYEGAPTPVTAFMAAAVKSAAIAGMIRVFVQALGGDVVPFGQMGWSSIFAIIAAITMTVGNIGALRQNNIKRMLAYSSVAHAGVLLVGLITAGIAPEGEGLASVLYYLLAYSVATVGAFGVVVWIGNRDRERVLISDWYGLGAANPAAAMVMTLFMLSFAGIPPTGGFFAKFFLFKSALMAQDGALMWLVIVGVLNSMISIFYYLKVVMAMYFREATGEFKPLNSGAVTFVLVACGFLVLQMGMMPSRWLSYLGV
ncbi:MAG: NADH-quinone oxidoreductase subunit N [Myxococcales bacterium]|nr:NADH-quinone oxidoreductase subunit N [Myxococcales bacterium]